MAAWERKLQLDGKEYTVVEIVGRRCCGCGVERRLVLVKSFYIFDTGSTQHEVPKLSYYCTFCGTVFSDDGLAGVNSDVIKAVIAPGRRPSMPNFFRGGSS